MFVDQKLRFSMYCHYFGSNLTGILPSFSAMELPSYFNRFHQRLSAVPLCLGVALALVSYFGDLEWSKLPLFFCLCCVKIKQSTSHRFFFNQIFLFCTPILERTLSIAISFCESLCYIAIALPPSFRRQALGWSIKLTQSLLYFQYEIATLADGGIGNADVDANIDASTIGLHPVLVSTARSMQGQSIGTPARNRDIAKGERDLSGLISALSSPERDFNFPAAWRASCPPTLYGEEPTWRAMLSSL